MACCAKTMMKVGVGVLATAGAAYLLLPESRGLIVALSPTLLFLLCPLSMLFCMKAKQGKKGQSGHSSSSKIKDTGRSSKVQTNVQTS